MVKINPKQNDTFLVTVEIITSDAIIVSANINSVLYRGALIRCNKNNSCLFKNISNTATSFSTNRLDLKTFKRQIRFKTYKTNYNLRRANNNSNNNKVKSKSKIYKSDSNKQSLSIKLRKDNGVYVNTSNDLSQWDKNQLNDDKKSIISTENNDLSIENRSNIIKIVKTKLNSNKYEYSISNNVNKENTTQSKILQLCLTPIPDILFRQIDDSDQMNVSNYDFVDLPPVQSENNINIIEKSPFKPDIKSEQSIIDDNKSIPTITQSKSLISTSKPHINHSWNNIINKLKIVKNGSKPNSYIIKPPDKLTNAKTTITDSVRNRYNCKKFSIGDIVWAKLSGYSIWPAKVIDLNSDNDNATVMWLGDDYRTSQLSRYKLWDFRAHFHEKFNKKAKGNYITAVQQAQNEYSKLDCTSNNTNNTDNCAGTGATGWIFDISSESSTLESVNIDDTSCELDQISLQESAGTTRTITASAMSTAAALSNRQQNIYLPLQDDEEEEFELMMRRSESMKSGFVDFLSFDSPSVTASTAGNTQHCNSRHAIDPFTAKYHNNVDYDFI